MVPEASKKVLRVGTRGSDLALWQARHIEGLLAASGHASERVVLTTRGDRIDDLPFARMEGKGFFTRELEDALLEDRVDLVVHSLKDLPTEMPDGLVTGALVGRANRRDLLLATPGAVDPERVAAGELLPLTAGAVVGTSAVRRKAQIRAHRADLPVAELRGNVPTRVRKLREGGYDAILIASAGVDRLDLDLAGLSPFVLDDAAFVPAPGQGMLAVQCREEGAVREILSRLHCAEEARFVEAERSLLGLLGGGCQLPLGASAGPGPKGALLTVFWGTPDGEALRFTLDGADPAQLATEARDRIQAAAREAGA
ncbi:MAG: hydroxymethylbilane synthase [Gemmatimonadota bacterium]|jgi:hydroxymethylbilane synthase|nr:hydroxymethylbilane synthase [Gemmatimonadota bacterium]MDP6803382.1 hydroxymethylbilane synthase [Gemmatimonadota bacterium]MDP7032409.1 hydroxymethylbilane synthase [Gemmatimonadota bacterium]